MARIIQIITLFILSLLMMSVSCDKGTEGCTDGSLCDYNGDGVFDEDEYCACNYDKTAAIDDNSCWFASEGCDCDDPSGSIIDCLEICDADADNDPPVDNDGNCCSILDEDCYIIVIGGCIDDSTMCNYAPNATHNDGSCAVDLSQYGGFQDGTDCDGNCKGEAVEDACGFCVGNDSTVPGQSWRMNINATAVFFDSTRVSDSAQIGASIYAENGYNNENIIEADCNGCYIDFAENCGFEDSLCFYFPHDEWKGEVDTLLTDGYDFDRDIRGNDLHTLFIDGIDWNAEISSFFSEAVLIDSLILDFTFIQGIESCMIKVKLDYGEEYDVQNNQLGIEVGSNENIKLTFNISNICFSEF